MTVETLVNRQDPYACDGETILFALTLPYFNESEITVTLRHKTTDAETSLTLDVHFEIPGEGDEDEGNIRLIGDYAASPPDSNYELHIIRILPLSQLMDIIPGTPFNATNNEKAFDQLVMICQQLADALARAAIAKTTSGLSGITLPIEAEKYLRGNSGGTDLEAVNGEPPTNVWRFGSGAPSDELGNNGDYYLNTANGDVYYKTGGTWGEAIANMKGPQGDAGDMQNPMTAAADLIVGGASGTPGRLAKGSARQVLRMNADATAQEYSSVPLDKLDGTAAPTVNEDSADGYSVGSKWADVTNDKLYICIDATEGAAVWVFIGPAYVHHRYAWSFYGECEVGASPVIFRLGSQGETVVAVKMTVPSGDEPTGCELEADIKEDGTTIFTTKPEIDATENEEDGEEVFSDTALAADAQISCEITKIGSTLPGSNLTVQLHTKEAVLS